MPTVFEKTCYIVFHVMSLYHSMGPITPMHTAIIFLLLAIEAYAHSMHTGGANAYVKQPLIHPRDATTTTTREHVLRLILVVTGGEMEGGERTHYDNLKHINRWAEENQLDVLGISPDWVDVRIPTDVYADDVLDRVHVPYKLIIPDVQAEIARERSQYLVRYHHHHLHFKLIRCFWNEREFFRQHHQREEAMGCWVSLIPTGHWMRWTSLSIRLSATFLASPQRR